MTSVSDPQPELNEKDERRLLAKIGLPDSDGCMHWLAAPDSYGYGQFSLQRSGRQYVRKSHRLIYALLIGPIPEGMDIDHSCGNRSCCAPDHLRTVTRKQNMENLGGAYRSSKTGIRGVSRHGPLGKWTARIQHDKKAIYLGLFDDIKEAERAVVAKRDEVFTHNDRDRAKRAEV